jgi:selenocysteine-specific elongation factor
VSRLVLGVIGHVDHGKSALVKALTGTETDRMPEEKQRGISIALGFAHLKLGPDGGVDLIDMPGHERFVRTMISGATGIDAVLLVVAANEGIKPQTREHVDIAGLLGLQKAVVAVSKADLVAPEAAAQAADEAARLVARAGLQPAGQVLTSAVDGRGIDALRELLRGLAASQRPRAADGLAYLPIDRAFSAPGHGPVVTGTLRGAGVAMGEALELWPLGRPARVRALQVHGVRVAAAAPGQRVALNLRDVEVGELERGMALAAPGAIAPSDWLTVALRAVDGAPPLRNGARLRALMGADEVDARLRLLDRDVLQPGEQALAQLRCARPAAVTASEHVVLRLASPAATVAGGRVLEPRTERLRRHSAPVLQRLEDLRTLAPPELVAAEVARAGAAGTTVRRLSELSALAPARVLELLAEAPAVVTRSGLVVARAALDGLVSRIPLLVGREPDGLAQDRLIAALPGTSAAVLEEAVARLMSRGLLVRRGVQLITPRPAEDLARAKTEAELADKIAEALRRGGLTPPDPAAIVTDLAAKRAVDRLLQDGVAVRGVDRAKSREILFHRDAVAEAQRRLAPLLQGKDGLLVSEIGAALGISRKFSLPLLDHLDAIRFTRRIDDRRIPGSRFAAAD